MNLSEIDSKLYEISKTIRLISSLKPINLKSEKEKVFLDNTYNPQFE